MTAPTPDARALVRRLREPDGITPGYVQCASDQRRIVHSDEDWCELCHFAALAARDAEIARLVGEVDKLASKLRAAESKGAWLTGERDAARAKAERHERDWYAAKSDFGGAMAQVRAERDRLAAELATARAEERGKCAAELVAHIEGNGIWIARSRMIYVDGPMWTAFLNKFTAGPDAAAGEGE